MIIDAHLHVVNPNLPGSKAINALLDGPAQTLAEALRKEMDEVGVEQALAMGCLTTDPEDPLGIVSTERVTSLMPSVHIIGVADPRRTDGDHLSRVEQHLAAGRVVALKCYLGYLYYGPKSPGYAPYIQTGRPLHLPVIFHTGDTYSSSAKLKFAHPLLIDEVAVEHPDVHFVAAHFGNPWLMDAALVVYKNHNVWADLSGLLVGDSAYFSDVQRRGVVQAVARRVAEAMDFSEKPDHFLYGSDWPLAGMAAYAAVVREAVPERYWPAVFEQNARFLFNL
jgi:predicted TIM-barrel fold metal-dependent hydrolase